MKRIRSVVTSVVLTALLAAGGAAAQEEPDGRSAQLQAMQRIELQLADIATTLRELRREQRVMRTLRRLEIAERRLEPLRGDVRAAKERVRVRNEELSQIESIANELRAQMQMAIDGGADPLNAPGREDVAHYERNLDLIRSAIDDAERDVLDAENELARARRSADVLDDVLREMLDELGER